MKVALHLYHLAIVLIFGDKRMRKENIFDAIEGTSLSWVASRCTKFLF